MDIEWIRQQLRSGNYEFSGHADDERQAERIPIADVEGALLNGEVLEDYPNDPRGPSCLVLGHGSPGSPIHVVCGQTPSRRLRLITVYIPSLPKWVDERTRRR
ncbi:DUF4258 domain-containing protein [Candidatus Uhrbacteria bacterium]|nr:DUF4258 domain-containing protein [Candidatus Uhrbacteria bacterium]